jgi:hypothetical protein
MTKRISGRLRAILALDITFDPATLKKGYGLIVVFIVLKHLQCNYGIEAALRKV